MGNFARCLEEFVHIDEKVISVDGSEAPKLSRMTLRKRRTANRIRQQARDWNDISNPVTKCWFVFQTPRDTLLFPHRMLGLAAQHANRVKRAQVNGRELVERRDRRSVVFASDTQQVDKRVGLRDSRAGVAGEE